MTVFASHPAWDAWIEIECNKYNNIEIDGRIPHGMRGLKYLLEFPKC